MDDSAHDAPAPRVPLRSLYTSFVRVGAGMFGGGYAMLPLLEREVADRRRWVTHDDVADLFALAQAIPGVIAVNTAMLIGQRLRGWRGAVVAALGAVTAPFLVILLIAGIFDRVAHSRRWCASSPACARPCAVCCSAPRCGLSGAAGAGSEPGSSDWR